MEKKTVAIVVIIIIIISSILFGVLSIETPISTSPVINTTSIITITPTSTTPIITTTTTPIITTTTTPIITTTTTPIITTTTTTPAPKDSGFSQYLRGYFNIVDKEKCSTYCRYVGNADKPVFSCEIGSDIYATSYNGTVINPTILDAKCGNVGPLYVPPPPKVETEMPQKKPGDDCSGTCGSDSSIRCMGGFPGNKIKCVKYVNKGEVCDSSGYYKCNPGSSCYIQGTFNNYGTCT